MFDLIRKPFLWNAWDRNLEREIGKTGRFHLKSIQDLAVYDILRGSKGMAIAEAGGGDSRLLARLARENACFNIEKFQGADGGPPKEIKIENVTNILVFLGEHAPQIKNDFFDVVFSVSVVEHVPTPGLKDFLEDGLRVLKPGGLWLHAIDIYIEDEPSDYWRERYDAYRSWMNHPALAPVGEVSDAPLRFTCDVATNPDEVMYNWGRIAPNLIGLRQRAQSASLLVAARKR